MFDIGFGELLVVAVLALVVLGPEKLPKAARTLGTLLRRVRDGWDSVRAEVEREIEAEEMKRKLKEAQEYMRQAGQDVQQAGRDVGDKVREGVDSVRRAGEPAPAEPPSDKPQEEASVEDPDADIFDRDLFGDHPGTGTEQAKASPSDPQSAPAGTGKAAGGGADEH